MQILPDFFFKDMWQEGVTFCDFDVILYLYIQIYQAFSDDAFFYFWPLDIHL